MGSNSMPYKPWMHQKNHSSSFLVGRGMEQGVPPKRFPPGPWSQDCSSKALPPLPNEAGINQLLEENISSWEPPVYREMMNNSASRRLSRDQRSQLVRSPSVRSSQRRSKRRSSSQDVRTPSISKSSQKILQLTGYDPRFERSLPKEHQQVIEQSPVSPVSSHSSDSVYSQP